MRSNFRISVIQKLIHINESIFFYPKLKRFYQQNLKGEPNILDVGANKGQSIRFFLGVNSKARIDSFEPNRRLFDRLQEKYRYNPNIEIHNLGVSSISGELEFHENAMDETSTFEELNLDSEYLERKARVLGIAKKDIVVGNYKVNVIRLSDFLTSNPNTFYAVLKIDVEGHELQCLEGLFSQGLPTIPVRFIQLESHNDDMYVNRNQHDKIEALLNANNFKKAAEIKHGFGDFAEIIYENKSL